MYIDERTLIKSGRDANRSDKPPGTRSVAIIIMHARSSVFRPGLSGS